MKLHMFSIGCCLIGVIYSAITDNLAFVVIDMGLIIVYVMLFKDGGNEE